MEIALCCLAALLLLIGVAGTILPALPGVPLVFAGMWLAAWTDHFQHIGWINLTLLGLLSLIAILVDFLAGLVGAKRVGASGLALLGAAVGTLLGIFFGLIGLLFGPFFGAVVGELVAGSKMNKATTVGVGTWIGLLFGTLLKLALCFTMLGVFVFALLLG